MVRATRSSMGKAAAVNEPQQLSSPPATPATATKKRSRKAVKLEDEEGVDFPHNMGAALPTPGGDDGEEPRSPPKKRAKRASKVKNEANADEVIKTEVAAQIKQETEATPSPKKTPKKQNYGLTPGISPYPDYAHPTPAECKTVVELLEKEHGKVEIKKEIPPPSLQVAGCGEVPSVLDALIRTRLSANTTNKNSSTAFQGLVSRFGVLKEGVGKGSVDWDAVRTASQRDVYLAIERGGLADRKSKDIQAIIQLAHDENLERVAALTSATKPDPAGGADEKNIEVAKAEQNVVSLDHIHLLSTPDAIEKMLTYPGIGPKTASCVALFCLQRPSFAVDTHVFRLCQYLSWVPPKTKKGEPKVDRNTTYSHCDAMIPDEYKYQLHYLFVKHGKVCPRCRAISGTGTAGWEEGCPIEHLVRRHGERKGGGSVKDKKKAKEAAEQEDVEEDGEYED